MALDQAASEEARFAIGIAAAEQGNTTIASKSWRPMRTSEAMHNLRMLDFEGYRSTALRHPKQPLILLPHRLTEVTGPLLGDSLITPTDSDLTTQHDGEPQGQRIIVTGQVLDSTAARCPTR